MKIAVIDAQGAGLGQTIIKKLRKEFGDAIYITALGTNSTAAANMLKSGADESFSGEKTICSFCKSNELDSIIGPIGIICCNGINGEITPMLAKTIYSTRCIKYLLPLQKHGIYIPGTRNLQIKDIIDEIILDISKRIL